MPRPEEIAATLLEAARARVPIEPLTDANPSMSVLEAYRIQQAVVRARLPEDGPVVGYKVGLTSKAMQEQLGVDQPDYGPILQGMVAPDGTALERWRFIAPRVEAEIAFILGSTLRGPGIGEDDVMAATRGVMASIEVIDSRIQGWRIKLADTVADMASSAMVVTSGRVVPVTALRIEVIGTVMERDGEEVSSGVGGAVLGHPARAVAWLANTLGELGVTLEAGHIVMPGATHGSVPAEAGHRYRALFDELGTVEVAFA